MHRVGRCCRRRRRQRRGCRRRRRKFVAQTENKAKFEVAVSFQITHPFIFCTNISLTLNTFSNAIKALSLAAHSQIAVF